MMTHAWITFSLWFIPRWSLSTPIFILEKLNSIQRCCHFLTQFQTLFTFHVLLTASRAEHFQVIYHLHQNCLDRYFQIIFWWPYFFKSFYLEENIFARWNSENYTNRIPFYTKSRSLFVIQSGELLCGISRCHTDHLHFSCPLLYVFWGFSLSTKLYL